MKRVGIVVALAIVAFVLAVSLSPHFTGASSHREAPIISNDPLADNLDIYGFVSPDKPNTVTLIATFIPMEEPAGGPNFNAFGDDVRYEIKVDNVGDAHAHVTYRFEFTTTTANGNTFLYNTGAIGSLTDSDWNVKQTYTVTRIDSVGGVQTASTVLGSGLTVPPANIGPKSTGDYLTLSNAGVYDIGPSTDSTKVFAGQRDDPFFVDLGAVFDLLTIRPGAPGNQGFGIDGLGGYNCHAIAIQTPISKLTRTGAAPSGAADSVAVIGVWSTASRKATTVINTDGTRSASGNWVQVSELGMPLVNEVVIPLSKKDLWNAVTPAEHVQFLNYVTTPELAGLLNALYGVSVPSGSRNDLVAVFLTGVPGLNQRPQDTQTPSEQMRLNMAIPPTTTNPKRRGVLSGDNAGFPNGRRLFDDIVDIELQAVAGVLWKTFNPSSTEFNIAPNNQLGDGVDRNDQEFLPTFPYMANPNQGYVHQHHRVEGGPTGINSASSSQGLPKKTSLKQNYPNPFNPETAIQYEIHKPGKVTLRVYNLAGQQVRTLIDDVQTAGHYTVRWDGLTDNGARVASGVYFYRIESGGTIEARKMLLVK
ncbi:MAG: DUF4331 family protein [Candidatus Latescibacteria bacterium]|nr:DUF4331 family protein [Candidatus Latescibacterota bacterium]